MVKDFKYIIKRVIIGVLISLAIMFLRTNVFAQSYQGSVIGNVEFTNDNNETLTRSVTQYTIAHFPNVNFYGFKTNAMSGKWLFIKMKMDIGSIESAGLYNIEFLFNNYWSGPLEDNFTFSLYYAGKYFVCNGNSSNVNNSAWEPLLASYKEVQGVKCENIPLQIYETNNLWLYVFVHSEYNNGNTFGITKPSLIYLPSNDTSNINDSIQETNDTLKDDSEPSDSDSTGILSNSNMGDDSNSPVSDLISMPITLLTNVSNNINGSCSTWNLGSLFGHNLSLPCINLQSLLGNTLYNLIDMAICLFLAFNVGKLCVTIYNNLTSLKDDYGSMYKAGDS